MRHQFLSTASICAALTVAISIAVSAQEPNLAEAANNGFTPVASRIVEAIDETRLTTLAGKTHPLALPSNDRGLAHPGEYMERMVLVLKRSQEQERAFEEFTERQYDLASPDFHLDITTGSNAQSCETGHPNCVTTKSVAFNPTAAVALSATLSVADNATGPPQIVTFKGTGK